MVWLRLALMQRRIPTYKTWPQPPTPQIAKASMTKASWAAAADEAAMSVKNAMLAKAAGISLQSVHWCSGCRV
jgi:hypothetical protein